MKPEETVFHEITLQDKAWMDRKFAEELIGTLQKNLD